MINQYFSNLLLCKVWNLKFEIKIILCTNLDVFPRNLVEALCSYHSEVFHGFYACDIFVLYFSFLKKYSIWLLLKNTRVCFHNLSLKQRHLEHFLKLNCLIIFFPTVVLVWIYFLKTFYYLCHIGPCLCKNWWISIKILGNFINLF